MRRRDFLKATPAFIAGCGAGGGNVLDSPVSQGALEASAGKKWIIPSGVYGVDTLKGVSNIDIDTDGPVVLMSTSNNPIFNFTNCTGVRIRGDLTLKGNAQAYPTQTDSGQRGILLDGCNEVNIEGIKFRSIKGYGVECKNAPEWGTRCFLDKLDIQGCYQGIHGGPTAGEYMQIRDAVMKANLWGILAENGNNVISGGWFIGNATAIQFRGGSNDGHSTITGTIIDHNDNYALSFVNLLGGMTVTGIQAMCGSTNAAGAIQVYNSRNIVFSACQFGVNFTFDGTDPIGGAGNRNGLNKVVNCLMRTDLSGMAAPVVQNGATTPQFKGNFTSSGDWAHNN